MLRRTLLSLLGLVLLAAQPGATWSIVCVNLDTREVAVATATCLTNFDIETGVPVIVVGEGAAAAQSFIDSSGANRRLIYFDYLNEAHTPAEILAALAAQDNGHQTRQYGIVNFSGDPVSFTGRRDGLAATSVSGRIGNVLYAIQGNVLTGDAVVFAAEAARALGGDGRCSCDPNRPTSCGVPPPNFTKSAHVACLIVARVGDTNAGCNASRGCAQGEYWLNINIRGGGNPIDPIFTLRNQYDNFRRDHAGRPDGILSRVGGLKALPADGVTQRTITVELRDIDERRLAHGGALLEVTTADGLPSLATLGPVQDLGNGRYTFTLGAGTTAGVDRFVVKATDVSPTDPSDIVTATLYPPLEIATLDTQLYLGESALSAAQGGQPAFVLNRADKPGARYLLVARLGNARNPGRALPGGLPVLSIAQSPFFPAPPLALDAHGRAEASLSVPPAALAALVGWRIEATGYVLDGGALESTNTAGFDVLP